ncbi:ABC transporter permease [Mesoaciditoga lauensis]|uniref:ABC transporter permease n=1 Tax=Mesoaciditoga lauensis TaxID=1495039 RepID=UPI0005657852|nr:ABC transporter permease [Mesoaciditoga lauensis]
MRSAWWFFKVHILSDLRNRRSVFWAMLFPTILLSILVLTFSNLGMKGSLNFKIAIVNESQSVNGIDYSEAVINAFRKLSHPNKDGVFTVEVTKDDLKSVFQKVLYSKFDAVIVIPKDFNRHMMRSVLFAKMGIPFVSAQIKVYYLPNEASSSLAQGAIEGVMDEINSYVVSEFHYHLKAFSIHSETIGEMMKAPTYTDFVTPGILVIGAFTTGLLLVGPKLAFMKRDKIMKKYASTPVKPEAFFAGFTLSKLFLMVIQYFLLAFFAAYLFNSAVHIFSGWAFLYYLFTSMIYILIGFDVGFLASSPTAVSALTSVINLPLEFLAGVYFPLFNLPWYVNIFVWVNPLWYATNAMRQLLNVGLSMTPMWMNIFVPALWGMASLVFLSTRRMWKRI